MKHVVVLGGGFAGVAAGLKLSKRLKGQDVKITLIDKNPYHLFTPSLYEVATSEAPQKNIAIPLEKVLGKNVTLLKDIVQTINPKEHSITLWNSGKFTYDYLIIAVGSQPAYMKIPGLKEYSIPFKWLGDAVEIKKRVKELCCKDGECNKKVQMIIGGGGFAGTELAEELLTYKDKIAKHNGLDKNCLHVTIIQGSDRLLKELDAHVSEIAQKRLSGYNVTLAFGGHIVKVDKDKVYTDNGKEYPYEILIWTGGVEANHIIADSDLPKNSRGQVIVNDFLQVADFANIFAAGDVAGFVDPKTKKPVPNVAEVAEDQGNIAAENIVRLLENKQLKPYVFYHLGYVVPLRGRFAVAELMHGIHFDGIFGWLLQQLVFLRYLLGILPLPAALMRWNTFEMELEQ